MNYLMLHDIRNISSEFFPERYDFPYFYTIDDFLEILKRFIPKSFNDEDSIKFIYTFDDGLIDHLYVAKLLAKKKIKSIFFIPSAPVLEREMIGSHKIQFILAAEKEDLILSKLLRIINKEFDLEDNYLDQFKKSKWENNIWSDEMILITRILREFKTSTERDFLVNKLFSIYVSSDEKDFANSFYLSNENVEEIASMGHIIGGHGNKSIDLRYCIDSEIKNEILISDAFISKFNPQIKYYAYANGGFNDFAISLLKELNFDKAFTTHLENEGLEKNKQYFCQRIDPSKLD